MVRPFQPPACSLYWWVEPVSQTPQAPATEADATVTWALIIGRVHEEELHSLIVDVE